MNPKNKYSSDDIVGSVALDLNIPVETVESVVSRFFSGVSKVLLNDGAVRVVSFGTFNPYLKSRRKNSAGKTIKFSPSSVLEKDMNSKGK